jgi:glycosyltransferase involved in cell wall biosynthesis
MVARLEIHKDQPTLIRAAARLAAKGIAVNVQLVGEGSRRSEYESLLRSLGLEQQVQLLGMRRDIPELLGTLDAFVFAATPDEGLGVALLEAMAAGVPIVATDVGACREVLDYGRLGKLVPPRDPEALAAAIEAVLQSPEQTQKQTTRGRTKVQSLFSIDAMARSYARCLGLTPA